MRRGIAQLVVTASVTVIAASCSSSHHPSSANNGGGGATTPAASSSSASDLKTTVQYSGVYDETVHEAYSGDQLTKAEDKHVHFTFSEAVLLTTPRSRLSAPITGTSSISDSLTNKVTFHLSGSISDKATPDVADGPSCSATLSGVDGVAYSTSSTSLPPVEIGIAALNPDGSQSKDYLISIAATVPDYSTGLGGRAENGGVIGSKLTSGQDGPTFCNDELVNGGLMVKDPKCAELWHPGPRETAPGEPPYLSLPLDTTDYSKSYSCDYTDPITTPGTTGTDVVTATGTLTVNASGCSSDSGQGAGTQSLGGGATIQLAAATLPEDGGGCPNIVWLNDPDWHGPGQDYIGGDTKDGIQPGQLIELKATVDNKDATSGASWTLPDGTAQDYTLKDTTSAGAVDTSATVTPVQQKSQPKIAFFFISAGSSGSTTVPVQLTLNTKVVIANFTIKAPSWDLDGLRTCKPWVNTTVNRPSGKPSFGLGNNDSCGNKAGMQFAVHINDDPGKIAVTQLVRYVVSHNHVACAGLDTRDYPLDNHDFYAVGGSRADLGDSPGYPLSGRTGVYSEDFFAEDHVMFLSHLPGSFWVPLGEFDWNWEIAVELHKGKWAVKGEPFVNTSHKYFTDQEPTWTSLAQNANAAPC